ncbi:MAG TPA: hypothetical protein VJ777_15015 [Mycobacterium sp.]|nr:hypothetical protein [Mycobacterium sp.]
MESDLSRADDSLTEIPSADATVTREVAAMNSAAVSNAGSTPPTPESASFVYALGRVAPRFPSVGVEKEFAQAAGRAETAGKTDRELTQEILQSNRYLARQACWVFTVEGIETYILVPRDPGDYSLLVDALRAAPRATDVDVVIGVRGGVSSPVACNGLVVPVVIFDQLYSFDVDTLVRSIPKPDKISREKFEPTAEELLSRIMQLADNAGATDEHRALNYLSVRYHAIYAQAAEMHGRDYSLTAVDVRPSRLSGVRVLVDVIFTFTNRQTGFVEQYYVRVDVTEEFPFLTNRLSTYYER